MDITVSFVLLDTDEAEETLAVRCMPQAPKVNEFIKFKGVTYTVCALVWCIDDEDITRVTARLV